MLLMWLGEQITDRGIGNGVSLSSPSASWRGCPQAARALKDMFVAGGGVEAQIQFRPCASRWSCCWRE